MLVNLQKSKAKFYEFHSFENPCSGKSSDDIKSLVKQSNPKISQMHDYYTLILNKKQGFLDFFAIFVDYAHFYVNIIMSTKTTLIRIKIQNFQKSIYLVHKRNNGH